MKVTLENIKARCTEVGECWEWNLQMVQRGAIPIWSVGSKDKVYPRREAWKLHTGREVPEGCYITNFHTCANRKCCNPEHSGPKRREKVHQNTIKSGKLHTDAIRAKISATKRAKSKLSDEAAHEIRTSTEPVPVLAKKHGISEAYGYMIRRGEHRRDYAGNPFAGLMK